MPRPSRNRFDQLVHEEHAAVFRSALRVLGRTDAAEDVAQEVFLRVLRGKVRLEVAASARATLCWLATRLACNALRSERRRTHHEDSAMTKDHTSALDSTTASADPVHAAAATDLLAHVTELLGRLPRDLRLPLQLRCQDELSYAAIGSSLAVSESTAHERCKRALDQLRAWLGSSSFAIAGGAFAGPGFGGPGCGGPGLDGAALGALVARVPAPVAPVGLEGRLLALGKASVLATAGVARRVALLLFAATAAVAATVAGTLHADNEPTPTAEVVAAAPIANEDRARQDPPPVRRPVPAPRLIEVLVADPVEGGAGPDFVGTVHDAGSFAVVGARVYAVAGGGLKPFELGSTTTGEGGKFELTLTPGKLGGLASRVKLRVAEASMQLLETEDLLLPRPADAGPMALVLPAAVGTEATRYALSVTVLGHGGLPLSAVPVKLYAGLGARPRPGYRGEVEGQTDGNGIALLRGRLPSKKWLFVDARPAGHAPSYTAVTIDGPGDHKTTVRLAAGEQLHGTIANADVGRSLAVWLEDSDGLQYSTKVGADGSLRFAALADRPYTLHVRGQPWSPVMRADLSPGSEPFHIELKRADDPRDVGDHMAELHGRLIDAETREEIEFSGFAVESYARGEGESSLATDAVAPPPPVQRSVGSDTFSEFHETGLTAGRWVLVARVPGYAPAVAEFTLGKDEVRAGIEVALHRGAELHGQVVDANGEPVQRAKVFLVGVGERADDNLKRCDEQQLDSGYYGRWPSITLWGSWTQADGTFALRAVPPNVPVRLVAFKKGYRLQVQAPNVHQSGSEVHDLKLRLLPR